MIPLTDFMKIGQNIDRGELTKVMDQVEFDDPCIVVFTSVRIIIYYTT